MPETPPRSRWTARQWDAYRMVERHRLDCGSCLGASALLNAAILDPSDAKRWWCPAGGYLLRHLAMVAQTRP